MNINKVLLETLRNQLRLSKEQFSEQIKITSEEYNLFERENNYEMFPAHSILELKQIMLGQEKKNFQEYKERFASEEQGIFTSNKILFHLDKLSELLDKTVQKQVGPITLEFHPTTNCNHSCPGCTFNTGNLTADKRFKFDISLLGQLIEDMISLGVRGVDISGGGEPLCHPEIKTILKKFSEHFDVGLVTNGGMLNDEIIDVILSTCTWCRVSVDAGSQTIYNEMHGNNANVNFENIVKSIKELCIKKVSLGSTTTLGVSYLLTPNNFLDVLPSINIFKEIKGLDYFQTKPIVLDPGTRLDLGFIFWDKRLFDILATIGSYSTDSFKVFTLSYKFSDMILAESTGVPFSKCFGHPFYPTVAANGAVLICCHKLNNYFDGDLSGYYGTITKERTLKDIWLNENRFNIGDCINTRLCPINCKLSETNKSLANFNLTKVMHKNFIN